MEEFLPLPETELMTYMANLDEYSSGGELSEIARGLTSTPTLTSSWAKGGSDLSFDSSASGRNPSLANFPGLLNFDLRISPGLKSKDPQYSTVLKKLFINQSKVVTINFRLTTAEACLPQGMYIRSLMIYLNADDFQDPVKVCHAHSRNSDGSLKSPLAEYLMRSCHESAQYYTDKTSGRHYIINEVQELQSGSEEFPLAFRFSDLGSCPGGLNRRDVAAVFTLEIAGNVIGRKVLPIRICTSPKRDMQAEEKNVLTKSVDSQSTPMPDVSPGDSKKVTENPKRKAFWVLAHNEENFKILSQLGESLEKKDKGDVEAYKKEMREHNRFVVSVPMPKKKPKLEPQSEC